MSSVADMFKKKVKTADSIISTKSVQGQLEVCPLDVANYFICVNPPTNVIKLIKMVFWAYGVYYHLYKELLFENVFIKTDHGFSIDKIYQTFKYNGLNPIVEVSKEISMLPDYSFTCQQATTEEMLKKMKTTFEIGYKGSKICLFDAISNIFQNVDTADIIQLEEGIDISSYNMKWNTAPFDSFCSFHKIRLAFLI
ncbi:hypothetical protein CCZ01_01920 [Helicobacter monodelphidis]|uniref:hypothetical protein n=1 Tax=Helicobacter sp. 15-1451 TaxID=2004995 RepID=UPI000DCB473C|nr:hypothetical protein [Helicobacter sp. 15-1451]RAX58564.1 hypothetical protein CCZ01_01920 [Helicobacter sp. 15-1451]